MVLRDEASGGGSGVWIGRGLRVGGAGRQGLDPWALEGFGGIWGRLFGDGGEEDGIFEEGGGATGAEV
jgi:hypothetical protein